MEKSIQNSTLPTSKIQPVNFFYMSSDHRRKSRFPANPWIIADARGDIYIIGAFESGHPWPCQWLLASCMGNTSCWSICCHRSHTLYVPPLWTSLCLQKPRGLSFSQSKNSMYICCIWEIVDFFFHLGFFLFVLAGTNVFDWCDFDGALLCSWISKFIWEKKFFC